ncbi:CRISPR-associated protein Csx19 [Pseudofrankia sp. BMG5.37]|uniref:type III-D CRISPR-associated protein Csx19 n=1 Tax=Pseudofrankia sp. BMG5.37 TaxID=3050035 RepID=UPI00289521D7|nr:CRISPR-associated protein Csx19 [Pseudofrankia sp. BMG5.37]MDT3440479.1 CRISPR-associated protein Csx19 [Pseudofrankia sp. BMG5.37]
MTADWRSTAPLRMAPGRVRLGWRPLADGTLTEALSEAYAMGRSDLTGAVALLCTPVEYLVARVDATGGCNGSEGPLPLDDVFEARVFTADVELRWVRRGDVGEAVLVGEGVVGGAPSVETDVIDSWYLLWGEHDERADVPDGWRALSAARVGVLWIPTDLTSGGRARLRVREYVGYDRFGNAYVLDERLCAIETGEFVRAMGECLGDEERTDG